MLTEPIYVMQGFEALWMTGAVGFALWWITIAIAIDTNGEDDVRTLVQTPDRLRNMLGADSGE